MFLSAVSSANAQPDYVALAMVVALLLAVAVAALVKHRRLSKPAPVPAAPSTEPVSVPTAPGSAGALKLHSVEPKTAAMIMAIVAHQTGKPLNELRFLSIKEVTPQ